MADGSSKAALDKDAVIGVLQGALQAVKRHIGAGDMTAVQVTFARRSVDDALQVSVGHGLIMPALAPWEDAK